MKQCLIQSLEESNFDTTNVKHVALISAKTGYGIEDLISKIHSKWENRGIVFSFL